MKITVAALGCLAGLLLVSACSRPGPGSRPLAPKSEEAAGPSATSGPGLGRNEFPSSAAGGEAAGPASAAPMPTSTPRSRVYVDPKTGEMRAPTPSEAEAESAAQASQSSRSGATASRVTPGVTVRPLPNGMTEYDLGEAGKVREQVCVQKDGTVGECASAPKRP
jgi:hypothetical protein